MDLAINKTKPLATLEKTAYMDYGICQGKLKYRHKMESKGQEIQAYLFIYFTILDMKRQGKTGLEKEQNIIAIRRFRTEKDLKSRKAGDTGERVGNMEAKTLNLYDIREVIMLS